MKALIDLHNGIMNDYSIRRYTLGWENVVAAIKRSCKTIPKDDDIQFEFELITKAAAVANGSLKDEILTFGRELGISLQTLREKHITGISRG